MHTPSMSQELPTPIEAAQLSAKYRRAAKGGADWFFWIAGLSVLNSIFTVAGLGVSFPVGLGITQLIDGIALGVAQISTGSVPMIVQVIAFALNLGVAGVYVVFGVFGRKQHRWAFVAGGVLYLLDALLLLVAKDFLAFGFHLFASIWIWLGFRAAGKLGHLGQPAPGPAGSAATKPAGPLLTRSEALVVGVFLVLVVSVVAVVLLIR